MMITNIVKNNLSLDVVENTEFNISNFDKIIESLSRKPNKIELELIKKFLYNIENHKIFSSNQTDLNSNIFYQQYYNSNLIIDSNAEIITQTFSFELKSINNISNCLIEFKHQLNEFISNFITQGSLYGISYIFEVGNINKRNDFIDNFCNAVAEFHHQLGIASIGNKISKNNYHKIFITVTAIGKIYKLSSKDDKSEQDLIIYFGEPTGREGLNNLLENNDINQKKYNQIIISEYKTKNYLELINELCQKNLIKDIIYSGQSGLGLSLLNFNYPLNHPHGFNIDLSKIPVRELGMDAESLLFSQTASRFCIKTSSKIYYSEVFQNIFSKWKVQSSIIGSCNQNGLLKFILTPYIYVYLPTDLFSKLIPSQNSAPGSEKICEFDKAKLKDVNLTEAWMQLLSTDLFNNNEKFYSKLNNHISSKIIENSVNKTIFGITQSKFLSIQNISLPLKISNINKIVNSIISLWQQISLNFEQPCGISINVNLSKSHRDFIEIIKDKITNIFKELSIETYSINFNLIADFEDVLLNIKLYSFIDISNSNNNSLMEEGEVYILGDVASTLDGSLFDQIMFAGVSSTNSNHNYPNLKNYNQAVTELLKNKTIIDAINIGNGGMIASLTRYLLDKNIGFDCDLTSYNDKLFEILFSEQLGNYLIIINKSNLEILNQFVNSHSLKLFKIGAINKTKSIKLTNEVSFDLMTIKQLSNI